MNDQNNDTPRTLDPTAPSIKHGAAPKGAAKDDCCGDARSTTTAQVKPVHGDGDSSTSKPGFEKKSAATPGLSSTAPTAARADTKQGETKTHDAKSQDARSHDTKNSDPKPHSSHTAGPKGSDSTRPDSRGSEVKGADHKPSDAKSTEVRHSEVKISGPKSADSTAMGAKSAQAAGTATPHIDSKRSDEHNPSTKQPNAAHGSDAGSNDIEYWRRAHPSRPYLVGGFSFEDYEPAYRFGRESAQHNGDGDSGFDGVESKLSSGWEKARGTSKLLWSQARHATRDAWDRTMMLLPASNTRDTSKVKP